MKRRAKKQTAHIGDFFSLSTYIDIGTDILNKEEQFQEAVLKERIAKAEADIWAKVKEVGDQPECISAVLSLWRFVRKSIVKAELTLNAGYLWALGQGLSLMVLASSNIKEEQ